jgi:rubredoxin/uncharacterized Fe-S cluster protein YjdI
VVQDWPQPGVSITFIGGTEMKDAKKQQIYECIICGYVYDPSVGDIEHGVAAGTPFDELPSDWVCPICGAGRDMFNERENVSAQTSDASDTVMKTYQNQDIIVYWYPKLCSHAGKCWGELPEVFDVGKRPWVNLSGSDAETIMRTIDKCPSHALQYSLPEGSSVNPDIAKGPGSKDYKIDLNLAGRIRVIRNGPILIEGPNRVFDPDGNIIAESDRFVLCRCGKTENPPFCDGKHMQKE